MCILGHAKPQNWYDPGVRRYCIPLYLVEITFVDNYYTFSHIVFGLKIQNWVSKRKKKADPCFPIFWVDRQRANKPLFSGLIHDLQ